MNQKLPISGFIITFNEESNIQRCIESLNFCNEIIVVDSGSSDKTVEIAKSLGAKVFFNEFQGYTDQKNFALNKCTNTWVLSLDADEAVSLAMKDFILKLDLNDSNFQAYEFRRLFIFHNKIVKGSGLYPDYKLRLFKKDCGKFGGYNIHETVELNGKSKKIPLDILHYSWKDIKSFVFSQLSYAEKVAQARFQNNKRANIFDFIFKPAYTFIHRYIFRLGFLDGYLGFIISFCFAFFTAYKYFKLWELGINSFSPFRGLGGFYNFFVNLRLKLYEKQILKTHKIDIPIISIGNLSMGGSGKTPFTLYLCKKLKNKNLKPMILTRGYKSKNKNSQILLNDNLSFQEVGDEALMMKKAGFDVISSRDRVKGAIFAKDLGTQVIVLDDGFQHLRLARDLNICIIDCSNEKSLEVFPLGNLREGFEQLKRADIIILSRCLQNPNLKNKILEILKKYALNKPYFELKESLKNIENLKNKKLIAFCGIGNPNEFLWQLKKQELEIVDFISFPDHYEYKEKDISMLKQKKLLLEADAFITTQKDIIKIKDLKEVFVADLKIEIEKEEDFDKILLNLIHK